MSQLCKDEPTAKTAVAWPRRQPRPRAAADTPTPWQGSPRKGWRGPQRLLRTDRSVFDSHSVRNSDKSRSSNIPMRDLRAILGLAADGKSVRVEPGVTVGEVTAWLLERELMLMGRRHLLDRRSQSRIPDAGVSTSPAHRAAAVAVGLFAQLRL